MGAILIGDIEDTISLEIFKGNLTPTLPNFHDQKYMNVKDIGLLGYFTGSTTLTFKDLPALEDLLINDNSALTILVIEHFSRLREVYIEGNDNLKTLIFEDLLKLEYLHINVNHALNTLVLRNLPALNYLVLSDYINKQLTQVTARRNEVERTFNYDDGDEILDFLNPQGTITGQEAMVRRQGPLIDAYERFVKDSSNAPFLNSIPQEGVVQQRFIDDTGSLFQFLKDYQDSLVLKSDLDSVKKRFTLQQALVGLQLLQGKTTDHENLPIPNHEISPHASYPAYKLRNDLPNTIQLVCLVYGIAKAKYDELHTKEVKDFAQGWLTLLNNLKKI